MQWTSLESIIDERAHAVLRRLPSSGLAGAAVEFVVFGLKQGWACLFGGLLLGLMLLSKWFWPDAPPVARYDALAVAALLIQVAMLGLKLETVAEAKVILIFHLVGTLMEIFKTAVGSWIYPEPSLLRIGGVPLFSGFMYAAVGSYLARISRIFDIRFTHYPPLWATVVLAAAIYVNFFSHHYVWDFRILLFAATALLFGRCWVHFRVFRFRHRMPLLLGFALVSLFIWIAENIATWSSAWLYPSQEDGWHLVGWEKLGAWFLLMIISFVLVTLVHRPQPLGSAVDSG
ncbi:MAG TPA: DUF817 domain-containing protein, partial [Devosia sp.]|nr:DUF817 domain-containing protein [Devosia sp.]